MYIWQVDIFNSPSANDDRVTMRHLFATILPTLSDLEDAIYEYLGEHHRDRTDGMDVHFLGKPENVITQKTSDGFNVLLKKSNNAAGQ